MGTIKKHWPHFVIVLVWLVFFWQYIGKGLVPIPADITLGAYYPWLDYDWGRSAGIPIKNPLPSDIPSLVYPWRIAVVDAFKHGHFPLWNNAYFLGMPLFATFQSAALSIANIFFLLFDNITAWSVGVIAQSLLSLFAVYYFLKAKGLKSVSSLLGSLTYSFSGYAVVWHQYNIHGWCMAILPLVLLTIGAYLQTNRRKYLLLLSLLIAVFIFSGYPPLFIYSCIIILVDTLGKRNHLTISKLLYLVVFFGFGLLLSAIQLIPGLELSRLSIRKIDPTAQTSLPYLTVTNLVTLTTPEFYGSPATGNYWGKGYFDNYAFWIGSVPFFLVLLTFAFSKTRIRQTLPWYILIAISGILVFDTSFGQKIAGVLMLQGGIATRALFLATFAFSVLSAHGYEYLLGELTAKRFGRLGAVSVVAFTILLVPLLYLSKTQPQSTSSLIALRNSLLPVISLLVLFTLCIACLIKKSFIKLMPVVVLGCVAFPLWYSAQKYWTFIPKRYVFPETPVLTFLKAKRATEVFRIEPGDVIPQNMWMPYGLETVSGYDTLLPRQTGEFVSLVEYGTIPTSISRVQLLHNFASPLFPLLNVKYILVKKVTQFGLFSPEGNPPSFVASPKYRLVFEDRTVQVYEDLTSFPRFWFTKEVTPTPNTLQPPMSENSIKLVSSSPNHEVLALDVKVPAFLVESASFYPGWHAYLDGQKVTIIKAHHALRAYAIPEGQHKLEIKYEPQSFAVGKAITLSTALLLVCYGVYLKRYQNLKKVL